MEKEKRLYELDNLKGLTIFLVVLGHMIECHSSYKTSTVPAIVFGMIYCFHMPLFAFISGYLTSHTQKEQWERRLILNCLLPFVLFHLFFWIMGGMVPGELFYPAAGTWYLLSLFFWRIMIHFSAKFRYPVLLAVLLAVTIGFMDGGSILYISRTLAFFPYFLAGYLFRTGKCDKVLEWIRKLIDGRQKLLAILGIGVSLAVIIIYYFSGIPLDVFFMKASYPVMGMSYLQGAAIRLFNFTVAALMIFGCFTLVSHEKSFLCGIGEYSMCIYLFHLLARKVLRHLGVFDAAMSFPDVGFLALMCLLSAGLCLLFGNQWAAKAMNFVTKCGERILLCKQEDT